MRLPPSMGPRTFTLSAFIIGFVLIDELTALEQNAIGNWFILLGQVLETSSSQMLVLQERDPNSSTNMHANQNQENTQSNFQKNSRSNLSENEELELLKKTLYKIQKQIDELMKENK